jgi:hypothetical protein
MRRAGGLFSATGVACLIVGCALPWQNAPESSPQDYILHGSSSLIGTDATAPPGDWYTSARTEAQAEVDEPAPKAEAARLAPRFPLGSPPGVIPADRIALIPQLQRELARVGCYEGEFNGAWTPSTRRAAKAFMDRVNAALPTDEPDAILLTLVKASHERVCGTPCPAGQGLAEGGQCVPSAILAARKGPSPQPARTYPAPVVTTEIAEGPAARPIESTLNPSVAAAPAPLAPAGPKTQRTTDAKRAVPQPAGFGFAFLKQLEKLGF